ncbi:MAG TPA: TIM barrel protein [Streptosporangiaceae bacterium]|nr:TIM barrel protein [Streptosporangiaceae bacterium]
MNEAGVEFAVFTKPWATEPVPALAELVATMGFGAAEIPVRPGFQVTPDDVATALPELVKVFGDRGLKVASIASSLEEPIFAACAAAGVPIIRIMGKVTRGAYLASEAALQTQLRDVIPLCEKYGVRVGVQEHYGDNVSDAFGLRALLAGLDGRWITAIWDAAHDALAGIAPETGLEVVWDRLAMVNLKNAFYERANGPEADAAEWKRHFTSGRHGMASWPRIAAELKRRDYAGTVCLTAEYEEPADVARLCAEDLRYAKGLFA